MRSRVADRVRVLQGRGDLADELDPERAAATMIELLHGQALAALLASGRGSVAEHAVSVSWAGLRPREERR